MNIPGYAAEASLYKSSRSYRAYAGTGSAGKNLQNIVFQQDCQTQCDFQYQQCLNNCGCAAGLTNCGGICTDVRFDGSNCGTCGHACKGRVIRVGRGPSPFFCFNGRCLCQGQCCNQDDAGNCIECTVPPAQCFWALRRNV
jgi:hypothetical protein